MTVLIYDGSFEGMLTAIFEVYERKLNEVQVVREKLYQPDLLSEALQVITDRVKAERVWKSLKQKLSVMKRNEFYKTFLSEKAEMETTLLSFVRHVYSTSINIETDFGHPSVLAISQIARQVHREKHRMEAFVRFQRTKEDVYFATIEPDFNVLPLIAGHFKDRYADQHWIIYDRRRDYGIHYSKITGLVSEMQMELEPGVDSEFLPSSLCNEEELEYQTLWKSYFDSVNIGARKNTKLHVRHVPTRYWRYLTEKR